MAVENFENIHNFEKAIPRAGFQTEFKDNLSSAVLPTMQRFEKTALLYYQFPMLTKLLGKILPSGITRNSIAGLLMPVLIEQKVACYQLHILRKP